MKTCLSQKIELFEVAGPYDIPREGGLVSNDISEFWLENGYSESFGCYIFAARTGRGITPLYVGKTMKSFQKECFTDHKQNHYTRALNNYAKCTPVMFFIVYPGRKSERAKKSIKELEEFLIFTGQQVNPKLRNIKRPKVPEWGIKGVLRSKGSMANKSAKYFREVFHLSS